MKPIGPKMAEGRDTEIFEHGPDKVLRVARAGHLLAELHEQLHRIPAPPGIRVAPLPGDRLVHRNLHPMNVMMTSVQLCLRTNELECAVGSEPS